MATGLIATGKVSKAEGTVRNKVLWVEVDGQSAGFGGGRCVDFQRMVDWVKGNLAS